MVFGRVSRAVAMVVLTVSMISFGSAWGTAPKPDGKVVKVGAAISFTGALQREGLQIKDGYQIWADLVNSREGVKVGNTNYRVQMIYYDDKSDAQTSAKLVEKLIVEDKVDIIFGPYGSGVTAASSVVNERYRKIMITPMSTAPNLYNRGFKFIFSLSAPIDKGYGLHVKLLELLKPKPETVAIVSPDDMFPIATAEIVKDMAEKAGFKIVYYQKYPKGATEFAPLLTDLKRINPDALLVTGYIQDEILIVKQSKELDVNFKYLGTLGGPTATDYMTILGKDGWYVFASPYWHASIGWKDPVFGTTQNFDKLFREKFKRAPTHYEAAGAAAGTAFVVAAEKAGTLDNVKLREALLQYKGDTVFMPVDFDETGRNLGGTGTVLQVQGGQLVPIMPVRIRQKEPVYPIPKWSER